MFLFVNVVISILLKILTFACCIMSCPVLAQEIWKEEFSIPGKGIWGNNDGTIQKDLDGITTWVLEYPTLSLTGPDDYAKTVSTSGGRFEVCDIDGEITWQSEWIRISGFQNVEIRLEASETGSSTSTSNKYLKAFFRMNTGIETLFATNGENTGNWGTAVSMQSGISGDSVQIVVKIANQYSSDKVILDHISVKAEEKKYPPAEPGDVVINEVLFNPFPGGNDFVEIYNRSTREISVNKLFLASRDKNLKLSQVYSLAGKKMVLLPGNYLAVTNDTTRIFPFYWIECRGCFQQISQIPSFNDDEDYVVLLNENQEILDELFYSEKMHNPFVANPEGISLERVSFNRPASEAGNWASASTVAGYATPGYQNSQQENQDLNRPKIMFSPDAFSPNHDGFNDEYCIDYLLEKSGYMANVTIFDSSGRFVVDLAKNEILGTQGKIIWNGEDKTGQRQQTGVYVVLLEIYHTNGKIYHFKDGVVLTDIYE